MIFALRYTLCFSVTVAAILLFGGCDENGSSTTVDNDPFGMEEEDYQPYYQPPRVNEPPPKPQNKPPVIDRILGPDEITLGEEVQFTVEAHDPDPNDKVSYEMILFDDEGIIEMSEGPTAVFTLRHLSVPFKASLRVKVSDGKTTVERTITGILVKEPPPKLREWELTKQFTIEGRRIGIFERNFWEDWERTLTFPGEIIRASWRAENPWGEAFVEKGAERVEGRNITLNGQILAKTVPISTLHVWVTAIYLAPE